MISIKNNINCYEPRGKEFESLRARQISVLKSAGYEAHPLAGFSFQNRQFGTFSGLITEDPLRCLDQFQKLWCRIGRHDVVRLVPEQNLLRFQFHAGHTQAMAEGVLQIMHAQVPVAPVRSLPVSCSYFSAVRSVAESQPVVSSGA